MNEVQLAVVERRLNALEKSLDGDGRQVQRRRRDLLYTVVNWSGAHKIDLGKRPDIKSFMARVVVRPAVQETLKAEGLVK